MGLVVQAGPTDVRGRSVVQEFFLDGVLIERSDRAQASGDGGANAAAGFQVAGTALDVGAARSEQPLPRYRYLVTDIAS